MGLAAAAGLSNKDKMCSQQELDVDKGEKKGVRLKGAHICVELTSLAVQLFGSRLDRGI